MKLAAAIAVALLAATSAHATAGTRLSRASENYLEGKWAVLSGAPIGDPCVGSNQSDDDWESYQYEFRRSGGSYRIVDNVDADWRGPISAAEKSGHTIHLQLSHSEGSRFKDQFFTQLGPNRMEVRESIGNVEHGPMPKAIAYRCSRAHHEVTAALPDASVINLTLAYFVEDVGSKLDQRVCAQEFPKEASGLWFELLGPAQFGVVQNSDSGPGRYWKIVGSKLGPNGTVVLFADRSSPTHRLTVISITPNRITVPELKADFIRCSDH